MGALNLAIDVAGVRLSDLLTALATGRCGGLATAARHGPDHMVDIGRRGAAAFWRRYRTVPVAEVAFFYRDKPAGADDEIVFTRGVHGPKRLAITLIQPASQTR